MATLAPPLALDGPLPVAPPHSLLATVLVIPPSGSGRFGVGGVVWPYPPGLPSVFDPCSTGTFRTKAEGEGWDLPEFAAFTVYLPITCSSITAHAPGFRERAILAFQATESFAIEREFSQGIEMSSNPYLADANADVLNNGDATGAAAALHLLEEEIGKTGRMGVIHATPGTISAWESLGFTLDKTSGGYLVTRATGTPVVSGGGYVGATPEGESDPGVAEAWAYATGPVQVRQGDDVDVVGDTVADSMDRSDNTVTFRAERANLVTWDTVLQAAILVDWTG